MTWEEKIRMAKEADPTLSDYAAAEVVHTLEQLAELALGEYERKSTHGLG
jgi:hypothetical protein